MQQDAQSRPVPEGDPVLNQDQFIRACNYVFDVFCGKYHVTEEMRPTVNVMHFINFIGEANGRPATSDAWTNPESLAGLAKVDLQIAELVLLIPRSQRGANYLMSNWPMIVLSKRVNVNMLAAASIMILYQYVDGTVGTKIAMAHKNVTADPMDDAHVVTMLANHGGQLVQLAAVLGIDEIYEQHKARYKGATAPAVISRLEEMVDREIGADPCPEDRPLKRLVQLIKDLFPALEAVQLAGLLAANRKPDSVASGFNSDVT